jgi:predicted dienelactone hydrolase
MPLRLFRCSGSHRRATRWMAALALAAAGAAPAWAQVGLQRESWVLPNTQGPADTVAGIVWYPTAAKSSAQQFGPFKLNAAPGAQPTPGRHPLVLISHGNGGTDLGHAWLAETLATAGYVVVAIRHPGSNHQDMSARGRPIYFTERPRHLSKVLDQLLASERWSPLIDAGRIAAIGSSAGGYTVLALAGGQADPMRASLHCSVQGKGLDEDTRMCAEGGFSRSQPAPVPSGDAKPVDVADLRIRAVVADAPLVVGLAPDSLPRITRPVLVQYSARDEVLQARWHGDALCKALPKATCVRDEHAGHYALFQTGTGRLGKPGQDPAEDPPGFDRAAWQAASGQRITAFLAEALR